MLCTPECFALPATPEDTPEATPEATPDNLRILLYDYQKRLGTASDQYRRTGGVLTNRWCLPRSNVQQTSFQVSG